MEIFRFRLSELSEEDFRRFFAGMSPRRQEKCMKYKREIDRKCCVAADGLTRRALSKRFGVDPAQIRIEVTPEGKPFAPDLPVFFSYAHCEDRLVLALDETHPVGADVEKARKTDPAITKYFCCDEDLAYIFNRPEDRFLPAIDDPETLFRLFEVWTFKESLGKALGTGLSEETKNASFIRYEKELYREDAFVCCAFCLT